MKILFVSAEVAPFAKVGGLADVAGSLPKALHALGHDVRIAMPWYRMITDDGPRRVDIVNKNLPVRISPEWTEQARFAQTSLGQIPVYLIGGRWFDESDRSEKVYLPGIEQHIFFAHATLPVCEATGWMPDVVHCNDWHTGLIPVLMREKDGKAWEGAASIFTIHNLAYQGEFGPDVVAKAGLPERLFNPHQLETFGRFNFLKSGCVYADQVSTVSPTYAREIQTPEYGCRLEGLMLHLAQDGRLRGILNGIDIDEFDPSRGREMVATFSASDPLGKQACKSAILEELDLDCPSGAPLMGIVSRLGDQKGIDLVAEVADELFDMPATLVIQALGDAALAERLRGVQADNPRRFRFAEKFDPDLAKRVYAGSDIFLMPSRFEPCGLGQMLAMRYGTIPVARHTGGLADTVFEHENGFLFHEATASDLLGAVRRAHAAFNGCLWPDLIQRAMRADHSWGASALKYEQMYADARESRRAGLAAS